MQKKKLYQLAAAIVLVVAVAAALILTGMRKSTPVSEAQASSVPSSALSGGEAEEPSSAAASSESAVSSEVTEESPVSSFLEQLEEELGISSSETASSCEASSAASAGKADSVSSAVSGSSAAHSVPASSAASGSSHASGSSAASENEVDARIDSYIRQLQNLKKQTESKLYGVIYEAYDEYISHPVEERNLGMKVSIVVSKTAKLTGVQGECDKEFNAILKELRQYLRENGRDQSVADQAEQEYKKMKSDLTSELTGIVYNSAVGSGDGGKWIQEHIEHKR